MYSTHSALELDMASILISMHIGVLDTPSKLALSPLPANKVAPFIASPFTTISDLSTASSSSASSSSDSASTCSSRCQSVDTDEPTLGGRRRATRLQTRSIAVHLHCGVGKVDGNKVPRARRSRKNMTEPQRIEEFRKEKLLGELRPHAAWCLECEDWIALDKRRAYYCGMWEKHMKTYHLPGGKQYELGERHFVQTGERIKLFKPRRSEGEWMFE